MRYTTVPAEKQISLYHEQDQDTTCRLGSNVGICY